MRQCKACPWKVSTVPDRDIPGGYCRTKHRALAGTIAKPGGLPVSNTLRVMACHESEPNAERFCVGWAVNQIGAGNNIALRMRAARDDRFAHLITDGPQHARFEDTLPCDD